MELMELQKALQFLQEKNVLVVESQDLLGQNYNDMDQPR